MIFFEVIPRSLFSYFKLPKFIYTPKQQGIMNANIMQSNATLHTIEEHREFGSIRAHPTFINHRNYDDIVVMQEDTIHREWGVFVTMVILMIVSVILIFMASRWFIIMLIIVFITTLVCIMKSFNPKPIVPWHISFSYESSSDTIPVSQV